MNKQTPLEMHCGIERRRQGGLEHHGVLLKVDGVNQFFLFSLVPFSTDAYLSNYPFISPPLHSSVELMD